MNNARPSPIYDIHESYAVNAEKGPFFAGKIPERPEIKRPMNFLGFSLNSPLGVPAGPLLNSNWVKLALELGFDLPVYKTIRSFAHPAHAMPNIVFVEKKIEGGVQTLKEMPANLSDISITNSFGMPSKSPDFLLADIARAKSHLQKGQELIVSIVGTPNRGVSFAEDFVRAALIAKEAGAKLIEANFSCPNVGKAETCLYLCAETVKEFATAIVKAIHPIPLIIKVGMFHDLPLMREVFIAAAKAGVEAICGLNSVSMEVKTPEGASALGPNRLSSGICGALIRKQALHFIRNAAFINSNEKLDLTLMGCGGIMEPHHFDQFLDAGALIAMSATGMMWDPYLAYKWHQGAYE